MSSLLQVSVVLFLRSGVAHFQVYPFRAELLAAAMDVNDGQYHSMGVKLEEKSVVDNGIAKQKSSDEETAKTKRVP